MLNSNERLSAAASLVLEALPNHLEFQGDSARALATAVLNLAREVEDLMACIWGFGATNSR